MFLLKFVLVRVFSQKYIIVLPKNTSLVEAKQRAYSWGFTYITYTQIVAHSKIIVSSTLIGEGCLNIREEGTRVPKINNLQGVNKYTEKCLRTDSVQVQRLDPPLITYLAKTKTTLNLRNCRLFVNLHHQQNNSKKIMVMLLTYGVYVVEQPLPSNFLRFRLIRFF